MAVALGIICAAAASLGAAAGPRNPTRVQGAFAWCDCGSGARGVELWPEGTRNESRRVEASAPLPNFIDWQRPVGRVSWRCDGADTVKDIALPAQRWWTTSLPAPLAGGLPTHPVGCAKQATARPHFASWAEGSETTSVVFATGEGPPSVPKPYACIKIPVLLHTQRGTLLALAEARLGSCSDGAPTDLIVKRSTSAGVSWSAASIVRSAPFETIGNAAPVQLRGTGRILLPHTRNNSDVFLTVSDSDGLSWSPARKLEGVVRPGWNWVGTGPPGSVQLAPSAASPSGRIVVPCYHSPDRANNNVCHGHVMLSDGKCSNFLILRLHVSLT